MFKSIKQLTGRHLEGTDGPIGKASDFLFDDERWVIRYLVANTGSWLTDRRVLISPYLLGRPTADHPGEHFPIKLTRDQIERCPGINADLPVSRRYERELAQYYAYPTYWGVGPDLWGYSAYPILKETPEERREFIQEVDQCHLRSAREVEGYHVHVTDGFIGHVEDFIVEDATWAIRYVAIDTRNSLPGKKVVISPAWIHKVDWSAGEIRVAMSREAVQESPELDITKLPDRDYEERLFEHYGHKPYWQNPISTGALK